VPGKYLQLHSDGILQIGVDVIDIFGEKVNQL